MNTKAVAFGLVIALVLTVGTVSALSNSGSGDWGYHKEIWIKENSGTSLCDYQVLVELEPSKFPDKAKSDCSDLRFTEDGKELSYWVEDYNVSAGTARIWVNVSSIPANGEAKVTMYYGNPDASAVSDGNATFVFFDDFSGTSLDTSKWREVCADGTYSVSSGMLNMHETAGDDETIACKKGWSAPITMRYKSYASRTSFHDAVIGFYYTDTRIERGWTGVKSNAFIIFYKHNYAAAGNGTDGATMNLSISDAWHTFEMRRTGAETEFYIDDIHQTTLDKDVVGIRYPRFFARNTHLKTDWLLIRKYASTEPTIALSQEYPTDYGLVAEWHFDEGSGNILTDSSGNGNDGIKDGATWTTGISENALEFEGVDDYVEVPDSQSLDITDVITIEAWVKRTRFGLDIILEKGGDWNYGETNYGMGLHSLSYNNMFYFFFKGGCRGVRGVSDFNWHHYTVVATNGATNPDMYIDGELKSIEYTEGATTMELFPSTRNLHIGAQLDPACSYYSANIIDEVAIYNRTLTADEIKTHYGEKKPAENNFTVAEWHFDEGSGNILTDSSGNGNDGIIKYGATWTTGISENALEFDGKDDYVEVPNSQSLVVNDAITIEAWVKRTRFDNLDIILEKGGDWKFGETNYGMGLHALSHNNMFYFFFKGGWRGVRGVSDFNWHHYTVVAANGATNPDMYIDGELKSIEYTDGATTMELFPSTRNLHIGAQVDPAYTHYGANTIDEIRIYNRALTATEIKTHYEEKKPAEEIATKQKIVFTSDRSGNSDIWMMDPDGTNLKQLTTNSSSDTSPQISPDGTKIAFLSDRTGTWQVWLMNTDGSNHNQLFDVNVLPIQYEYGKRVDYPTWAPDGSYLITHIELVGEVHSAPWAAIYRHDPDGSNPQLFLDWGPSINGKFSISSDGRKFAYCREDSSYWTPTLKISVGNIVEGVVDETSINNLNSTIDGQVDEDVVWFSNGNKLMWSKSNNSEGYGIPQNLYSMNVDETDIKKLTAFTDKYARMPGFAPDEQKVVFTVSNETTAGIYIMNANGSGVQALLVDDYKNSGPCWGNVVLPSLVLFDTGEGTYPSISGTHNGTIKPSHNFTVNKMYTYPCAGTGGHTETIELYESGILIANGTWNGYSEDNQNVTIHNVTGASYVTLLKGHEYSYTIKTGSYPQIIHKQSHTTLDGSVITCTEFIDVNGKRYDDWIPAIGLTYSDASNTSDAVLILNFDEGSGAIAKDESGYGNDGTIYGAKWVDGKFGEALEFDGVDDYVDCGNDTSLNLTDFSIEAWIKAERGSGSDGIISKTNATKINYELLHVQSPAHPPTNDIRCQIYDGMNYHQVKTSTITQNEWYHIMCTRDSSKGSSQQLTLYVNGVQDSITTYEVGNPQDIAVAEPAYIGLGVYQGNRFFNGTIDKVRIYNRALTANEIKRHYEG